ncbi:tetraacyldisaccharide 4'-kinase [Ferruginivarius sediminum]|uniref:Tetraacyldisaccharide 4'-kinase n=1 Tax=Ferruginivarius sediminum TaxID=2661937 RepID=A0A369TAM5_9PROT|nr:tetraacyldisaccharide 4'-kinase [Ferruginivarius sediminum]RDD62363.1 tetraacyldisaccharide 4'-kinase [Ferruginivarius sediminum]
MRPPEFWARDGVIPRLLSPLSALYDAAGVLRRQLTVPRPVGVPVICVGNATVGGTGKTPVAIDLAWRLSGQGLAVHLLTRGYGARRAASPVRVNPAKHTAVDVGDEALLLARAGPTWVSPDRIAGARKAVEAGAQVIVMDDGLQNPHLANNLALLVVDGAAGFGNGRVLPAGPLRESLWRALDRSDAVVVMGRDRAGVTGLVGDGRPVLKAKLIVPDDAASSFFGKRVLAFAGIGRPEKFFRTLAGLGADVVESRGFPDHHAFTREQLRDLLARAESANLTPVTTEKDAMRLPEWARWQVSVLPVAAVWDDPAAVDRLLEATLAHGAA